MAVNIPTLNELYLNIKGDLEAEMGVTIFGKSYLRALAAVQAAKMKLYYLAIANLQKNIFPDTADSDSIGGTLERFGRVKLGRNPFAATAGEYTVTVTGDVGATIPANTTFKSSDLASNPSKIFSLDTAFTFTSTTGSITIRALEGGLDSELNIGEELTATAPLLNADELVVVTAETIAPLAAEDIEEYREKVVQAFRLEPQGGAASDYRLWSEDAQGVRRVYPYAKNGFSNEIVIYIEATLVDSIDGKGTPSTTIKDDVEDVVNFDPDVTKPLNERGRRPLGILHIDYLDIVLDTVDIEIVGMVSLTAPLQTQIEGIISDMLYEIRPFVAGADVLADRNDILNETKIIFAIQSEIPTALFTGVNLKVNGSPTASFQFMDGNIPSLNTITYV